MAGLPAAEIERLIKSLSPDEYRAVNWFYVLQAREKQLPPEGEWFYWLIRSGRGFGKTKTGAEFVIERARSGFKHIALIGQTKADVRDTMIEVGESSILRCSPPWFMPEYQPSKRRLVWPNGAIATAYSGDEPDQLRGPQHDTAWVDELAKFRYPDETLENLELGLRIGRRPQAIVTTTPRPIPVIRRLVSDPQTVDVTGTTYENVDNLSPAFITRVIKRYEGTRLGQQELHGLILDDDPRALWNRALLEETRATQYPDLHRIVVAVDPHATSGQTGIIVCGIAYADGQLHGYVLDDTTSEEGAKPAVWGKAAVAAYHKWQADMIVGEINNGGDMIEHVIRSVSGGEYVPYKTVRASRGKYTRAEPISAAFEQRRGHMVGYYADLEDELCTWIPGEDSPNRLDAMVWAFTELDIVSGDIEAESETVPPYDPLKDLAF